MAYLALLWKARTIEKCRLKYEKEKINSILATNTELPANSYYQKWTAYRTDSEKRLGKICSNVLYPEGSKIATSCSYVKENSSFLLRNVIGIVGGIVLLYFSYQIFVFELAVWSVMSWAIGVVITLGFVFSYGVRCLVLLLIPGLFSRVGRYTLACYALVLILTGPATNTIKNLDTLSECLACGQEQIKTSVRQMKESRYSSLNLVKETMNATVEKIQYLATKIKEIMVKIHRLTMSIAHVLQSSLSWLNSVEDTCNNKLGTPYHHCIKTLAQDTESSEERFTEFSGVWKLDDFIQAACISLKLADPLCMVGDFAKGSIVATVKNKLMTYSRCLQSMLSVAVHIRHSHSCCNGSVPVSQAAAGIVTDLRNRADPILTWLSWSCTLTGLFLLLTIFRAKYYQFMFRTRSRFDNRYITTELRELDLKRQRQGRDTVLPLNTRERVKYVSTASIRLLPSERTYLARSITFMVITTFKLMIHMVADYSLYWVLMNIRSHGSTQDSQPTNQTADIRVEGSGPLAATVRMLLEAISVPLALPAASPKSCLPRPHPPDLERYAQIGTLILALWLLALFEPYGLRLRHIITGHYQPERAKARAVWLYYHIIRTRNCFLKYARRKLHRAYKYTSEEKFTFRRWLSDCIPCSWLRSLLGVGPRKPRCLLCYTKHHQEEPDRHLKTCETPSCPGVYCARCFMDIGQLCTICYSPEHYGDLSDVSLERFSSDESGNDESDDDYEGDNKPLLGTYDYVIKGNESGAHTKETENCKQKLKPNSKNDNQESLPLLDYDCLNKDYTKEKKARFECAYRLDKLDKDSTQRKVTKLKTKQLDCSNIGFVNQVYSLHKETKYSKDLEITIKGVTIPKERLGAIIRTMMLLTAKINDDEYIENDNNLQHESFKSSLVIEKKLSERHTRCVDKTEGSNKSFKTEISFLNVLLPPKVATINVSTVPNLKNSKPILKHDQDNQHQEKSKNKKFAKQTSNKRARKRNMKRYLEIRKLITTHITQRIRKRRIHFNKREFSWKRRRRRFNSYSNLSVVRITSNGISNKTTENGKSGSLDDSFEVNQISSKTSRPGKHIQTDTNYFAKNETIVMHAAEWYSKNSSVAIVDEATSVDAITDPSFSNDYKEMNNIKAENETGSTTDRHIKQIKSKKRGFWANIRLRITDNQSHTFSSTTREKLFLNNLFRNRKRRKKLNIVDSVEINKARKVNDDARNYRISLFMKDQEWLRNVINNKDLVEEKQDKICLEPVTRKHLEKGPKHIKKEKYKDTKHEIDVTLANKSKPMDVKRKAELAKEKQKDIMVQNDRDEWPIAGKQRGNNKPAEKDSSFIKILKKISRTALNLPKLHEVTRSMTNVHYNVHHLDISESKDNSEVNHKYTNISGNENEKEIEKREHIIEDLKREIFNNERLMTSDYADSMPTDSKHKDSTKSVTSCVPICQAKQKEDVCCKADENYDTIKHTCTHYQAKTKPQNATSDKATNIPSLDESLRNSKGIQINLSKYNEVTQTNVYEPGLNISPHIHYNEFTFDKASYGCKDNTRKEIQRKETPDFNVNVTKDDTHKEQNYNDHYGLNDKYKDIEKGDSKIENINGIINGNYYNERYANYTHNLNLELTLHDSSESVITYCDMCDCDCEHVWQIEPKKHEQCQTRENKGFCNPKTQKAIDNRCTINQKHTELALRSDCIKCICKHSSKDMSRRNSCSSVCVHNNSCMSKEILVKCCRSCQFEECCNNRKYSKLCRWLHDKCCVSSSSKSLEKTKKKCNKTKKCCDKQNQIVKPSIRDLETQTQITPAKYNQTQHLKCGDCNCLCIDSLDCGLQTEKPRTSNFALQYNYRRHDDRVCTSQKTLNCGLQTEKPRTTDFALQYRYRRHEDREISECVSHTTDMSTAVTIKYTNEKPQPKEKINLTIWSLDSNTTSETRTPDGSTTYDWWSPILERKSTDYDNSSRADPFCAGTTQRQWSFSRFQRQSSPVGSASENWCLPVMEEEHSHALKYFKRRQSNRRQVDENSRNMKSDKNQHKDAQVI